MAKRIVKHGSTSRMEHVFLLDSASTTGAGKTGVAASAITAYYIRNGGTATSISLAGPGTIGTWNSTNNWTEVSSTNMPGLYEFDIPDAVFASGADHAVIMIKGTGIAPVVLEYDLVAYDSQDTVRLGLTSLPNAAAEASGGLITRGTGTGQLSVTSGAVTVGTNNDKTGYSLSSGAITASVLATDAADEIADRVWGSSLTVNSASTAWANDTFGKSVLRAYNNGNAFIKTTGTGAGHVAADVHEIQPAVITNAAFAADAIDSNALAASACTEIWQTDISGYSNAVYAGTYLKNATSDWTADQRTAIRSALGIPATGTTLTSPAIVLAKTTNITGFNDVSTAQVNSEVDTALSDVGLTTTITGRIDAAISTRSTLAASDVWSNATRTLSSGGNTDISNAVWDATKATWTDQGTKGSTMGYQLAVGITPVTPPTEQEIATEIFSTVPTLDTGALTSFGTIIRKINTMMEEVPGSSNQNFRLDSASLSQSPSADSAAIANAVWDELTSENRTAGSYGELVKNLQVANYVATGQVATTVSAYEFTSNLTAPTGAYSNLTLVFTSGSCIGQANPIKSYTQSSGRVILENPLTIAPNNNDTFIITPVHVHGIGEMADGLLSRKINGGASAYDVRVSTSTSSDDLLADNLFSNGDKVKFVSVAPGNFTAGVTYYVINAAPDKFQLSATLNGAAIRPGTSSLFNVVSVEDRTVRSAMRYLRNRVQIELNSSQLKVYREDDTDVAWTSTLQGNSNATPIIESNPTD